jgi:predicted permease
VLNLCVAFCCAMLVLQPPSEESNRYAKELLPAPIHRVGGRNCSARAHNNSVEVGGGTVHDAAARLVLHAPLWAGGVALVLAGMSGPATVGLPPAIDAVVGALAPANTPLSLLAAGMLARPWDATSIQPLMVGEPNAGQLGTTGRFVGCFVYSMQTGPSSSSYSAEATEPKADV